MHADLQRAGRPALIYTNKGLWDGLVDKSAEGQYRRQDLLFLAWFGTVQPEYGKNNTVLPSGWTNDSWPCGTTRTATISCSRRRRALRTLLEFCEVATDDSASQDEIRGNQRR
jgi:hypothetical protein